MQRIKYILRRLRPLRVTESLNIFLRDESIGGKLVVAPTPPKAAGVLISSLETGFFNANSLITLSLLE